LLLRFQRDSLLYVDKVILAGSKIVGKTQGGIEGERPLSTKNFLNTTYWNSDIFGQSIGTEVQGNEKFLRKELSNGQGRHKGFHDEPPNGNQLFQHVLLLQLHHNTEIAIKARILLGILNPYIKANNLRIASTT